MTKHVSRITRGSGDGLTPRLRILAFASDAKRGGVLVDQLTSLGVTSKLVVDDLMAVMPLLGDPEYDAVVVDAAVSPVRIEEMLAQVTAIRRGKAPIGIIHMVDDLKPVSNPVTNRSLSPLTQSVASQDLGAALDALSRSAALTAADVQRQVEIITRAAIRLGQRLNSINHSASTLPIFSELDDPVLDEEPSLDVANTIAALRRIIRERRVRERFFKEVRFGEPAWDIILDLTLAWFEGKSVAVSSLCIASGVPMSTAMRWINDMIEAGLINRWIDPVDGRRNLMQISPATRDAMLRYLAALNVSENAVSQSSPEAGVLGSRSH
jgi:nucleotide-binding universal stress UspA family protein